MSKLSFAPSYTNREDLSRDPQTSPEILTQLSDDINPSIRYFVAVNPSTPPETLTKLSDDSDYIVRRNVASNPNTPSETLIQLDALEAAFMVTNS